MQFAVVAAYEDHAIQRVGDFLDVFGYSLPFSQQLLDIYSQIQFSLIGEILSHDLDVPLHVLMEDLADPFEIVAVDL